MYSQNLEEHYILNHFKGKQGTFLDVGAYDGIDLSNTRALAELGWGGICFEPNPNIFEKLCHNQMKYNNIYCYKMALGEFNGTFTMQMNNTYYSTLKKSETQRWNNQYEFKEVDVEVIDFKTFMITSPYKTFDFISIDCEGVDYEVLIQMDLNDLKTSMICVETNGKETQKYVDYVKKFGRFNLVHMNPENIILAR